MPPSDASGHERPIDNLEFEPRICRMQYVIRYMR
jgi:hypothetical protein